MKASSLRLVLLALLVVMAGCSQQPVETRDDVVTYLKEAEPVSVQAAQTAAINELLGDGLRAQGKVYTKTFTAVDLYDAPFVHINITSPKKIGNVWRFAKKLKGNEWPQGKTSAWGITITGATQARTPVSQIENGLGTFRDVHKTVKAMGGPKTFKKIVAPLSTVFWLEDKNGALWSVHTHKKVSKKEYKQAKKMYDDILAGIEVSESDELMSTAWAATPTLSTTSISTDSDGAYNLADFATLSTQATYKYEGSWRNPEAGQDTLIGGGGYAQEDEDYERDGENWTIGICAGGYSEGVEDIGCGPASFSAMLAYNFKYRGAKVNNRRMNETYACYDFFRRRVNTCTWSYTSFLQFITKPTGSRGVPLIVDHMGSCRIFGGTATAANAYSRGKTFLEKYTNRHLAYNWSRGFSNPRRVDNKNDILLYAKKRNLPVVVEYPLGVTKGFHYSLVKEWRSKRHGSGLFIKPENHPSFWVNMGDSFKGEVGVWTIY